MQSRQSMQTHSRVCYMPVQCIVHCRRVSVKSVTKFEQDWNMTTVGTITYLRPFFLRELVLKQLVLIYSQSDFRNGFV